MDFKRSSLGKIVALRTSGLTRELQQIEELS